MSWWSLLPAPVGRRGQVPGRWFHMRLSQSVQLLGSAAYLQAPPCLPLQAYISQLKLEGLALTSDMVYVTQSGEGCSWVAAAMLLATASFVKHAQAWHGPTHPPPAAPRSRPPHAVPV